MGWNGEVQNLENNSVVYYSLFVDLEFRVGMLSHLVLRLLLKVRVGVVCYHVHSCCIAGIRLLWTGRFLDCRCWLFLVVGSTVYSMSKSQETCIPFMFQFKCKFLFFVPTVQLQNKT